MKQLIEYTLEDGSNVLIEAETPEDCGALVKVAKKIEPSEVVTIKDRTFEAALKKIKPAANALIDEFHGLKIQPEEVKVAFGIAVDLKAGWFITTGTKANFDVTLTWKKS